jgi:hypothetical protein
MKLALLIALSAMSIGCTSRSLPHLSSMGVLPVASSVDAVSWPVLPQGKTEDFRDYLNRKKLMEQCGLGESDATQLTGLASALTRDELEYDPGYSIKTGNASTSCQHTYGGNISCSHSDAQYIHVPPSVEKYYIKRATFGIYEGEELSKVRQIQVTIKSTFPEWTDETFRVMCEGLYLGLKKNHEGGFHPGGR